MGTPAYPINPGHQWLQPLIGDIYARFDALGVGDPALRAHAAITSNLAGYTYANGTAGVGATLTAGGVGAFATQDGVPAVLNNIYLVAGQSTPAQNGVYRLTTLGDGSNPAVLTRVASLDQAAEFADGLEVAVGGGTVNADTTWKYTGPASPVLGTDALTFARDPGTVTTNTAQTVSGAKTFTGGVIDGAPASATLAGRVVADPGASGAIPVTADGLVPLVSAGAETRTLAAPAYAGQRLTLCMKTDGGDITVTCATFLNQAGNNTLVFNDAGDMVNLVAIQVGSNLRWRISGIDGVTPTTV